MDWGQSSSIIAQAKNKRPLSLRQNCKFFIMIRNSLYAYMFPNFKKFSKKLRQST